MYYLFIDLLVCLHWKIRRFTAFLGSKIHTRLAIVTANDLALAFPPRNLPKKFRPDPSTFYLVIAVTDKQTNRQTCASDSIILAKAFAGIINTCVQSLSTLTSRVVHQALLKCSPCHNKRLPYASTRTYQYMRSSCSVPRRSSRTMQIIGSTKQQ